MAMRGRGFQFYGAVGDTFGTEHLLHRLGNVIHAGAVGNDHMGGECRLGDCKPESCKKYPFTNQPERLWSLLGFLESVSICPVAYEICERLKQEYHFI